MMMSRIASIQAKPLRVAAVGGDAVLTGELAAPLAGASITLFQCACGEVPGADLLPSADAVIIDGAGRWEAALSEAANVRAMSLVGIVVLTDCASIGERILAMSLGVDHVLEKPVDIGELVLILRNLARPFSCQSMRATVALRLIRLRELQRTILKPFYFDEPAFSILLNLYVNQAQGRPVYQSHAYRASLAPTTTAHRWLLLLERDGLIERRADMIDRRRSTVRLTEQGGARVEALLDAWLSLGPTFPSGSEAR